jgi:hypothetical protein
MYFCTGEYPDLFLVDPVDNEPMGAGNAFFIIQNAIFFFENDPFAKTGLGQTDRGKATQNARGACCAGLAEAKVPAEELLKCIGANGTDPGGLSPTILISRQVSKRKMKIKGISLNR